MKNKKLFLRNLLTINLPAIIVAVARILTLLFLNVKIWYYHIDEVSSEVFYFVILISCLGSITKHVEEIQMKRIFIRLVLPVIFCSAGYSFLMIYLCSRFKVADSTEKYLIRLVYYPLIVELSLILLEYCCRTFNGGISITIHGRAHFIFSVQVAFGILGRYMTMFSGNLIDVTIFSAFHFLKDVFIHWSSWLQCYVAHRFKRLFGSKQKRKDFDEWFYSSDFQEFRVCVFSNDFMLELTGNGRHYFLFYLHWVFWVTYKNTKISVVYSHQFIPKYFHRSFDYYF